MTAVVRWSSKTASDDKIKNSKLTDINDAEFISPSLILWKGEAATAGSVGEEKPFWVFLSKLIKNFKPKIRKGRAKRFFHKNIEYASDCAREQASRRTAKMAAPRPKFFISA